MTAGDAPVVCEDRSGPDGRRPRVTVDPGRRVVVFDHCHHPRTALSAGPEPRRVCPFEDVHAARDFLQGDHRGWGLRTALGAGRLVGLAGPANELGSIFVSTAAGRARVFANWHGFPAFREAIREVAAASEQGGSWEDDPRIIGLGVVVIGVVVAAIVWALL